jgi:hypothetical protein
MYALSPDGKDLVHSKTEQREVLDAPAADF